MANDLEWHVTGLWKPGETSVVHYGRVRDPAADEVFIPLDDSRTASVTLNLDEDLVPDLIGHTYARCLRAYHHGRLVFWGPINLLEVDTVAGTCKASAVDPSLRLRRHYLREGDLVIEAGVSGELGAEGGQVPVDHTGLRLLRDAGKNTTEQTARHVPDLGIEDGTNDFVATPFNLIGVERGMQVWNAMLQLSQSLGPDFELEPVDDVVGAYCKLNTYAHQGDDLSATVAFHYATGKDNLEGLRFIEGAKYTTHVHVLPADPDGQRIYRFSEANTDASAETGPYVDWDATDYDSTGIDADKVQDVLRAYGRDVISAYSRPLVEVTLIHPLEADDDEFQFGRDYRVGDTISAAARTDDDELPDAAYRITSVRLKRDGDGIRPEVTIVADMVAAAGDTPDSTEE